MDTFVDYLERFFVNHFSYHTDQNDHDVMDGLLHVFRMKIYLQYVPNYTCGMIVF